MSIEIKVPAMGESVTEATVARWFKKEGESVARDEPLLELETDKVTVEVPAPAAGSIESISVKAGATVQVGASWARSPKAKPARPPPSAAANPDAAKPAGQEPKRPSRRRLRAPKTEAPAMPSAPPHRAKKRGVPTSSVAGTGRDGRVTKGDMLGALEARASKPAAAGGRALPVRAPMPSARKKCRCRACARPSRCA